LIYWVIFLCEAFDIKNIVKIFDSFGLILFNKMTLRRESIFKINVLQCIKFSVKNADGSAKHLDSLFRV